MSHRGIHLTLLIGVTVPVPAPALLTESLDSVEVTNADSGRSGFQLTFKTGRSGSAGLSDDPLLSQTLLQPFNRVVLSVSFNLRPQVLMDGIITNQQFNPSNQPGSSTISVTGEDVSVMMDRNTENAEHPAQTPSVIVTKLILEYSRYGLIPMVTQPQVVDQPAANERVPVQRSTDLGYIEELAKEAGHVFYVNPGPALLTNQAYWGPPKRVGHPQPALSFNLGAESNVSSLNFTHDALQPTFVKGEVHDTETNDLQQVKIVASSREPLAAQPTWSVHKDNVAIRPPDREPATAATARGRAQATTDASNDDVVTANGELDALSYGNLLRARGLVGLRGAGHSYDGLYYVKSVTHNIRRGEYKQSFTLTREGVGSTVQAVQL